MSSMALYVGVAMISMLRLQLNQLLNRSKAFLESQDTDRGPRLLVLLDIVCLLLKRREGMCDDGTK
jgi:hypothetical protein